MDGSVRPPSAQAVAPAGPALPPQLPPAALVVQQTPLTYQEIAQLQKSYDFLPFSTRPLAKWPQDVQTRILNHLAQLAERCGYDVELYFEKQSIATLQSAKLPLGELEAKSYGTERAVYRAKVWTVWKEFSKANKITTLPITGAAVALFLFEVVSRQPNVAVKEIVDVLEEYRVKTSPLFLKLKRFNVDWDEQSWVMWECLIDAAQVSLDSWLPIREFMDGTYVFAPRHIQIPPPQFQQQPQNPAVPQQQQVSAPVAQQPPTTQSQNRGRQSYPPTTSTSFTTAPSNSRLSQSQSSQGRPHSAGSSGALDSARQAAARLQGPAPSNLRQTNPSPQRPAPTHTQSQPPPRLPAPIPSDPSIYLHPHLVPSASAPVVPIASTSRLPDSVPSPTFPTSLRHLAAQSQPSETALGKRPALPPPTFQPGSTLMAQGNAWQQEKQRVRAVRTNSSGNPSAPGIGMSNNWSTATPAEANMMANTSQLKRKKPIMPATIESDDDDVIVISPTIPAAQLPPAKTGFRIGNGNVRLSGSGNGGGGSGDGAMDAAIRAALAQDATVGLAVAVLDSPTAPSRPIPSPILPPPPIRPTSAPGPTSAFDAAQAMSRASDAAQAAAIARSQRELQFEGQGGFAASKQAVPSSHRPQPQPQPQAQPPPSQYPPNPYPPSTSKAVTTSQSRPPTAQQNSPRDSPRPQAKKRRKAWGQIPAAEQQEELDFFYACKDLQDAMTELAGLMDLPAPAPTQASAPASVSALPPTPTSNSPNPNSGFPSPRLPAGFPSPRQPHHVSSPRQPNVVAPSPRLPDPIRRPFVDYTPSEVPQMFSFTYPTLSPIDTAPQVIKTNRLASRVEVEEEKGEPVWGKKIGFLGWKEGQEPAVVTAISKPNSRPNTRPNSPTLQRAVLMKSTQSSRPGSPVPTRSGANTPRTFNYPETGMLISRPSSPVAMSGSRPSITIPSDAVVPASQTSTTEADSSSCSTPTAVPAPPPIQPIVSAKQVEDFIKKASSKQKEEIRLKIQAALAIKKSATAVALQNALENSSEASTSVAVAEGGSRKVGEDVQAQSAASVLAEGASSGKDEAEKMVVDEEGPSIAKEDLGPLASTVAEKLSSVAAVEETPPSCESMEVDEPISTAKEVPAGGAYPAIESTSTIPLPPATPEPTSSTPPPQPSTSAPAPIASSSIPENVVKPPSIPVSASAIPPSEKGVPLVSLEKEDPLVAKPILAAAGTKEPEGAMEIDETPAPVSPAAVATHDKTSVPPPLKALADRLAIENAKSVPPEDPSVSPPEVEATKRANSTAARPLPPQPPIITSTLPLPTPRTLTSISAQDLSSSLASSIMIETPKVQTPAVASPSASFIGGGPVASTSKAVASSTRVELNTSKVLPVPVSKKKKDEAPSTSTTATTTTDKSQHRSKTPADSQKRSKTPVDARKRSKTPSDVQKQASPPLKAALATEKSKEKEKRASVEPVKRKEKGTSKEVEDASITSPAAQSTISSTSEAETLATTVSRQVTSPLSPIDESSSSGKAASDTSTGQKKKKARMTVTVEVQVPASSAAVRKSWERERSRKQNTPLRPFG